jgi:hypothetical protein
MSSEFTGYSDGNVYSAQLVHIHRDLYIIIMNLKVQQKGLCPLLLKVMIALHCTIANIGE